MKRKTTLTNEQIELINQGNELTGEEAWEEFLTAKEMLGVTTNTMKHYETVRRVTYRDLPVIDIEKELLELNRKDIESLILYWKTVVKIPTIIVVSGC